MVAGKTRQETQMSTKSTLTALLASAALITGSLALTGDAFAKGGKSGGSSGSGGSRMMMKVSSNNHSHHRHHRHRGRTIIEIDSCWKYTKAGPVNVCDDDD